MSESNQHILIPYTTPAEEEQSEQHYLRHRLRRRFAPGQGSFMLFSAEQVAKLAKVNLRAAARLNHTLEAGFDKVDKGQIRIHEALLSQTDAIQDGFDRVALAIDEQREQQALDAEALREEERASRASIEKQTDVVAKGFAHLASRVDMGMSGLLAQFELQRAEMQEGLNKISAILSNQHKTNAQERFLDGQTAYGQYLRHPDEPRLLLDAENYLQASVDSWRGNPFAHLYLGHIYHEAGPVHDLQKAQSHYLDCATYAKGIDNRTLAAQAYMMAGWLAYVRRLPARAVELGKLAVEYDPEGLPEAYFNLGKYLAHLGKAEEAIAQLDIAIKSFDPLYSLKASLDQDYSSLGTPLDDYFHQLKTEEQAHWDARLSVFGSGK
jgi:tetratricopeptide (TPR) repeat protein